jgi:hypothetical protein
MEAQLKFQLDGMQGKSVTIGLSHLGRQLPRQPGPIRQFWSLWYQAEISL